MRYIVASEGQVKLACPCLGAVKADMWVYVTLQQKGQVKADMAVFRCD